MALLATLPGIPVVAAYERGGIIASNTRTFVNLGQQTKTVRRKMRKTLWVVVCLILALMGTGWAEKAEKKQISFDEVNTIFGSRTSRSTLWKDEMWKAYKGKCVTWIGKVVHISSRYNFSGGISISFKHRASTFSQDVLVMAPMHEKAALMELEIGKMYEYKATLVDYGGAILPIQADWGCRHDVALDFDVDSSIEYHGIVNNAASALAASSYEMAEQLSAFRKAAESAKKRQEEFSRKKLDRDQRRKFDQDVRGSQRVLKHTLDACELFLEDKEGLSIVRDALGPDRYKKFRADIRWIRRQVRQTESGSNKR